VPITFTDRAVGTSKMTSDIVREAMLRVLTWRWRELAHHPDRRALPVLAERPDEHVLV
jgi:hypothetical protein